MQNGKLNWAYTGWIYYKGSYQYIVKGVLHEHSWEAETKTVHHEAVYENYDLAVCECGAEFESVDELDLHQNEFIKNGIEGHGACGGITKKRLVSDEYDEEVVTGYRCSVCGAYKSAE